MDYFIIKIIISCSVIGYCWTNILTDERQILDFVPKYYPSKLYKPLTCPTCLSGWIGVACAFYYVYTTGCYCFVLVPFYSMVLTEKILLR